MLHLGTAKANGAHILGGEMFTDFCALLSKSKTVLGELSVWINPEELANVIVNPEDLNVYGINFSPPDLDSFVSVRSDQNVKDYAHRFCDALLNKDNPLKREKALVRAIREAIDMESVSKRTAGVLETTASALGIVGLIPVVGTITGGAGIVADASARSARAAEHKSRWYLVGTKMQEVALMAFLRRKNNIETL